jgi:zinc transporter ZupT
MATDLTTINVLLGIMAAVSRRQALAVLSLFAAGALLYRRVRDVVRGIEERQAAM